jgi:hypothetical protein
MSGADHTGTEVVTPLTPDEIVVRLRDISRSTLARSYDLLDVQQRQLASIEQRSGGAGAALRRQLTSSPEGLSETFELRDGAAGVLLRIARHRRGRLNRAALVADVQRADGSPMCTATSAAGADGPYTIAGPSGDGLGEVARGARTLFVVTAAGGSPLARIDAESNRFAPQQTGSAHPSSYLVRFHADTPMSIRVGTLAVLVTFDSVRGP